MKRIAAVSIVIPTRNRLDSLNRTLASIQSQTIVPSEIIIVDSSDFPLEKKQLQSNFLNCDLQIIHSKPSVCEQRNIGIKRCTSDYILLCDDDIEISESYLENLVFYLNNNPSSSIVSGLVCEKKGKVWLYAEKRKSFLKLIFTHIFGLSVWTEIKSADFSNNIIIQNFVTYYLKKGNRIAKSGWPIVINYNAPYFKTPIYGLGATLFKSENLKNTLFDTAFYENGIGDNYDLAISLNNQIIVIKSVKAFHHREQTNRLNSKKSYFYRVSALHYIMKKHKQFNNTNLFFLIWSLIGNSILFLLKGKFRMVLYNCELIIRIIFNFPIYKTK